eukprot:39162_1
MDSAWREATNTSSLWRKLIVIGATYGAAELLRYYLNHKRKDLPEYQRKSFTLFGYGYATQVALKVLYIQNTRPVPIQELILFPIAFPVMYLIPAYFAKPFNNKTTKIPRKVTIANILYFCGLFMLIGSEYGRKVFKSKAENKGKLYTTGFNGYTRHPNYLAEAIIFTGWTMLSNNKYLLSYPILMVLQFYVVVIPEIEQYLKKRYSVQWGDYEKNVKSLIPFVY